MRRGLVQALLFLLALIAWPLQAAEPVAQVVSIDGAAEVERADSGESVALAVRSAIYLNDLIKTSEKGRVKLLLGDDSVLKVSPRSQLRVTEQVVGPGEESRTTLNLLQGKLRSLVGKKLGANSRFEVHTSVAVAGVRGTDFEVLALEQTLVRCFEGLVAVGNIRAAIDKIVMLTPNTFTRVFPGMAPTPPEFIAPGESIEGKAGVTEEEGESGADGGEEGDEGAAADELDDLETYEVEEEAATELEEFTLGLDEVSISEELIEEHLFGKVTEGQIDTVIEQPGNSVSLPLDITIPAP